MASEADRIAQVLGKRKGVLFDVAVLGNRTSSPDGPGSVITSARADGDKLLVQLAFAAEPDKPRGELLVVSPSGLVEHKTGAVDIERAREVHWAGKKYERFVAEAPAVRFNFE